jgi:uncharacterized damage-inducible protein DinB
MNPTLTDFIEEFHRYRSLGERALAQVPDDALNRITATDGNSLGMLVRHISGNFASRFTDFRTTDGEKPWRHRDDEFETRPYTRAEVDARWRDGWAVLEQALAALTDDELSATVTIRGTPFTVHGALSRALAHVAYHVGQMVLLARMLAGGEWQWLTIPKGASKDYNANPMWEKGRR